MAMEQKSKLINETTYLVTTMDGVKALRTQTKMVKILGPSVLDLLSTKDMKKEDKKKKMAELLVPILNNFDDEEVSNFVLSLFDKGIFVEKRAENGEKIPQPVDFATHFAGNINEVWNVVFFILEVNFSMGE